MKSIASNKRFLQIKGNKAWLRFHNKVIPDNTVEITNCTDICIFGPEKFYATNVFFKSCNVVLQRLWLNNYKFPYIKHIYIDSEYDPITYNRFNECIQIYITEEMINSKPYFVANDSIKVGDRYVKVITKERMNTILYQFQNSQE